MRAWVWLLVAGCADVAPCESACEALRLGWSDCVVSEGREWGDGPFADEADLVGFCEAWRYELRLSEGPSGAAETCGSVEEAIRASVCPELLGLSPDGLAPLR